jgi:hypothetical protein
MPRRRAFKKGNPVSRFFQFPLLFALASAMLFGQVHAACASCSKDFMCEIPCEAGKQCAQHDDDCGNWESIIDKFPHAKSNPIAEVNSVQNKPTDICIPGTKGPVLPPIGLKQALKSVDGNWLLAMALKRLDDLTAVGVYDSGLYSFPLAETASERDNALAGQHLEIPTEKFKGFNGFVEYRTTTTSGLITAPNLKDMDIELHVWRINRAKIVPTHGLKAYLHYEKDTATADWTLRGVRVRYAMPTPGLGRFENLDQHKELVNEYLAGRSVKKDVGNIPRQ